MTNTSCPRHGGHCAYSPDDPDRCPFCHSTWEKIERCHCPDDGSRESHLAVHARRDATLAKARAKKEETVG